jgi:uncharacterized NAD(P)/FAD-binding protein YdhS
MNGAIERAGDTPIAAHYKLFEEPFDRPAAPAGKKPIAVIGAGFSGTIATLHLLRRLPADQPVLLCERAPEFARGVAYGTANADHLLNVRASNMSALADDPNHFSEWLKRRAGRENDKILETEAGVFANRGLYGEYLRGLLDFAMRETAGHAQLRLLPDDVVDVVAASGGGYELVCASGQRIAASGIVLAVGNLPPEEHADPRICANPWGEKAWRTLPGEAPVLIVGTGLTMVDLAISMRRRGFAGKIVAMSRGGLLAQAHTPVEQWPTPQFTLAEERSLSLLMARLRDEVFAAAEQGVGWRAVIDSIRPVTAKLWKRLPLSERRRFLRHGRRYWDVLRHRMAPPHAALIEHMQQDGSLQVLGGRISRFEIAEDAIRVRYTPRGRKGEKVLAVQRVIMANGLEHIDRTRDPLMQRLLERGLIRLDAQGLGLDVTDGLNVIGDEGRVAERIWALGPIVRGVFWECVAVPDIRVQASHVAVSVVARLREDAPRWSFII